MPDLKEMKVLIIGPGPTNIGQTGEGLEGALEACQVLSEAGCHIITVGANPDAVFNEAPWSNQRYLAPLVPETISDIIATEKPDALLTLFGGRNCLQLIAGLYSDQATTDDNLQLWGPTLNCLSHVRDRDTLQSSLTAIGLKTPPIHSVSGTDAAIDKAQQMGFPVVVRCDDAHVLPDGVLIYNLDELNSIVTTVAADNNSKFSVEASLLDWQQIELEVMRDRADGTKLIGGVEYLDTAGVHPGDAIGVSPIQSLSESLQTEVFRDATTIVAHLDIVGSATIRFAVHPESKESLVLAVHPRHTATSAFVARVSGLPVAQLSTMLAAGLTWDQLPPDLSQPGQFNDQPACVGVKWPNWDFSQLGLENDRLGPQMQATGYHVSYGKDFKTAFHKASHAGCSEGGGLASAASKISSEPIEALLPRLSTPSSRRPFEIFAALTKDVSTDEVVRYSHIAIEFIDPIQELACTAKDIRTKSGAMPPDALLLQAKEEGFTNKDISLLLGKTPDEIDAHMIEIGVARNWLSLPGRDHDLRFGGFNFETSLPAVKGSRKVIILANGAHGIGSGAECDYSAFQAAVTAKQMGYTPILVNSNLSSLLTGHCAPCTCYCEPLSIDEIADIIRFENPVGVITQFAGTAADSLADRLSGMNYDLIGISDKALELQQDPVRFKAEIRQLGIPQPASLQATTIEEAKLAAEALGFPILVGGGSSISSEVLRNGQGLDDYLSGTLAMPGQKIWMEQFLEYAIEAQAEVLCDGEKTHTLVVMEHIELAGVHPGDSAAVLQPYSIAPRHMETIRAYCDKIATDMGVRGLINVRFGVYRDTVYVLGAGSQVSRNLATISKALDVPAVEWTVRLMLGEKLTDIGINPSRTGHCSVRAPVFPFNAFSKIDPLLGPNMRATGQVMSIADTFGMAYFRALEAAQTPLPTEGTVLITVTDEDKSSILEPARIFSELGFKIMATRGTHNVLAEHGIASTQVRKLGFGRPNLVDEIKNGHVQMVINTPTGGQGQIDDSVIRKAAISSRIANITTPASALAAAKGIEAALQSKK